MTMAMGNRNHNGNLNIENFEAQPLFKILQSYGCQITKQNQKQYSPESYNNNNNNNNNNY